MAREDCLERITSEFKLWGVKFTHTKDGSGHIELRWRASPDKEERRFTIAMTASDWRAPANNAAHVRRLFKADGLVLVDQIKRKKPPALQKALSLPEPVETDADQIKLLRAQVGDLADLVLEMAASIEAMKTAPQPQQQPVMQEVQQPEQPLAMPLFVIPEKKRSMRSIKTIEYVGTNWSSTDALARDMGIEPFLAYRKLYYLQQNDIIEKDGNLWRRKPVQTVPAGVLSKRRVNGKGNGKLNGHHH